MTIVEALYLVLVALILAVGFGVVAGILALVVRLILMFFRGDFD